MRTKALLLAAAFAAAGISTSMAQGGAVYSVNAVGYVNLNLPVGFSMVANPLDAGAGNNTVSKLFSNIEGGVPNNTQVFVFNNVNGTYATATYSTLLGGWSGAGASAEINPGTGVFFNNRTAAALKLTFVGEVKQGDLVNQVPVGFSVQANQVPQSAKPDATPTTSFPGANNDRIYRFNPDTKQYQTFVFSTILGGWNPALPTFNVGEAFFYFRQAANGATTWTRTFNVNNS